MATGDKIAALEHARTAKELFEGFDFNRSDPRSGSPQATMGKLVAAETLAGDPERALELLTQLAARRDEAGALSEVEYRGLLGLLEYRASAETKGFTTVGLGRLEKSLWITAAEGHGPSVADYLRGGRVVLRRAYYPLWAAHVTEGREELAAALRWWCPRNMDVAHDFESAFLELSWSRRAAQTLGDEELVALLEPIIERYRREWTRRDIAVLLAAALHD